MFPRAEWHASCEAGLVIGTLLRQGMVWFKLYMVHRLEHWNEGLIRGRGLGGDEHRARDFVMSAFMYVVLLGVAYFADKSVESHPVANRYCIAIAD